VITDAEDRVEWVNAAFTRMTGHALPDAAGRRLSELLRGPGADLDALARMDEQLRREQKSAAELRYQLKDGRSLWLAVETHAVLGPDGRVQQYISIGRDVTERHAVEQQLRAARDEAERASRTKSEFLSAMSHELRTPMNAILGFAQLMQSDPDRALSARQHAHLQQILRAGAHLLELIDDVLDLARVEAGRQPITIEPVQPSQLLEECLTLMRPLAEERRVRFDGCAPGCCSDPVAADRTRLKQVLLNLLSNAIKYNEPGGSVTVACRPDGDDALVLAVTDSGPGLHPAQQERLFQAFERLGAEQGAVRGAGIGLALSKRLVELMGGQIGVESAPGAGSTFWLRLPRASSAPAAVSPPAALGDAARAAAPDGQCTVLYVEDNPVNVVLMEALLEREPGVRLVTAQLPELGLELAHSASPDLILLDIQLPGMDGYEVLRRLRASERHARTPIVAISANAMRGDIERGLGAGFDAYLTKPLDIAQLLGVVRSVKHA
jgi:PAS domain S-box-containing protein